MRNTLISSSQKLAQLYKTKSHPLKNIIQTNLLNRNEETFIVPPTADEEISDIISDINIRKIKGPNSLTTKVTKQIKDLILAPSGKLINRSSVMVFFLTLSK